MQAALPSTPDHDEALEAHVSKYAELRERYTAARSAEHQARRDLKNAQVNDRESQRQAVAAGGSATDATVEAPQAGDALAAATVEADSLERALRSERVAWATELRGRLPELTDTAEASVVSTTERYAETIDDLLAARSAQKLAVRWHNQLRALANDPQSLPTIGASDADDGRELDVAGKFRRFDTRHIPALLAADCEPS